MSRDLAIDVQNLIYELGLRVDPLVWEEVTQVEEEVAYVEGEYIYGEVEVAHVEDEFADVEEEIIHWEEKVAHGEEYVIHVEEEVTYGEEEVTYGVEQFTHGEEEVTQGEEEVIWDNEDETVAVDEDNNSMTPCDITPDELSVVLELQQMMRLEVAVEGSLCPECGEEAGHRLVQHMIVSHYMSRLTGLYPGQG